jgi:hypothetical protein
MFSKEGGMGDNISNNERKVNNNDSSNKGKEIQHPLVLF